VFIMASAPLNPQASSADHKYQALLAVSEAIVSHRDLSALFHELASRHHLVVRFDYLALYLHEATSNAMRMHVLEGTEPTPLPSVAVLPLEEDPAGCVWQTQQARNFSNVPEGNALAAGPRTSDAVWDPEFLPFAADYSSAGTLQEKMKKLGISRPQ
jgi:hypothetical protein